MAGKAEQHVVAVAAVDGVVERVADAAEVGAA